MWKKENLSEGTTQELLPKLWKLEYYFEGMDEKNTLDVLRELQTTLQQVERVCMICSHWRFTARLAPGCWARIKRLGL